MSKNPKVEGKIVPIAKAGFDTRTASLLAWGHYWNTTVPLHKRPIVRIALSFACAAPVLAYLISAFLQMRGYVNITASRTVLEAAVVVAIIWLVITAVNLRRSRIVFLLVTIPCVIGAAIWVDRITITPKPPDQMGELNQKLNDLRLKMDDLGKDEDTHPGYSEHLLVKIGRQSTPGNHYLFDYGSLDKNRLSLYLSTDTNILNSCCCRFHWGDL